MNIDSQGIIFSFMGIWSIISIGYFYRLGVTKRTSSINLYVYNSIPSVFTTLGVLGTFVGIFFGLQGFDVANIDASIPLLLEGMKTAFSTSIVGIFLSIVFRLIGQAILNSVEKLSSHNINNELEALKEIISILNINKEHNSNSFDLLNNSLSKDIENSIFSHLAKLDENFDKSLTNQTNQFQHLKLLQSTLTDENGDGIYSQLDELKTNITAQNKELHDKLDEFFEMMIENNTESLVEVMNKATESFNNQMSELLDKLVKENFNELNESVKNLNLWQHDNKDMIETLTDQFKKVSNDFSIASDSIKKITDNTENLTKENSLLSKLIKELQAVMIDDTKFQNIVGQLESTTELVKNNIIAFDETTNKLNSWVQRDNEFKQSLDILIGRLEEIEKIKDINGEFWSNTKIQLEEGVSLIKNSTIELRDNLDDISEEFTGQLNQTLTSLDELIQRLAQNYIKA